MRRTIILCFTALSLLGICTFCAFCALWAPPAPTLAHAAATATPATYGAGGTDDWDLVLLTSSDSEGRLLPFSKTVSNNGTSQEQIGGFARMAGFVAQARSHFPDRCLLVSAGDDLLGPFFREFHGEPFYEAMDAMGFDAGTLGNHAFDLGSGFLAECLPYRKFPVLAANLTPTPDSPLAGTLRPSMLLERGGVRVGLFGLVTRDLALISQPGPDLEIGQDYAATAKAMVDELRAQGAELVVALAHIGQPDARSLAEQVPGIDVICVGGSDQVVEPGREVVHGPGEGAGSRTLVIQAGLAGEYMGLLKLQMTRDAKGRAVIARHHWTLVRMDNAIQPDPQVAKLIAGFAERLPAVRPLTRSLVPIDTRKITLRTGEAAMGSFLCDLLRERYRAQICLYNGGGIRGDRVIDPGAISSSDVRAMFPFEDKVALVTLSGAELLAALERSAAALPEPAGQFLQVSGLRYAIDLKGSPQRLEISEQGEPEAVLNPGSRVLDARVQDADGAWRAVDPTAEYRVVTSSYLTQGGDGYIMLRGSSHLDGDSLLRDVVETELSRRETIDPRRDGRITFKR